MSTSHKVLRYLRLVHLYMGVFLAPSILFFAFTGAMQSFSLHESHSASYTPPHWLVEMAQMHKKQTFYIPPKRAAPPAVAAGSKSDKGEPKAAVAPAAPVKDLNAPSAMKFFFLLVALGLAISTLTGIYMSYKFNRNSLAVTGALVAGVLVPVGLAVLFP